MKVYKILCLLLMSTFAVAQSTIPVPTKIFQKNENLKGGCYRIPSLITAQDGTLLAVADQRYNNCRDLKDNDEIDIVLRRSFDNGSTWTPIQKVVDYPKGQSSSDASMVLNKITGEILLFYNYMDLKNARDIYKQFYVISKDNGKTWSNPREITNQIAPKDSYKDFKFITSGRAVQDKNGIIYQTLVDLQKGVYIFKTEDGGISWSLLTDRPVKPADETTIAIADNGNILLNARVRGLGARKLYEFTPQGELILDKVLKDLTDPACNASFISYNVGKNNILLFSNANSKKERKNMSIKFSVDNAKTWSKGKVVNPDHSAYSSLTQMSNNNVGILYEVDDHASISFNVLPIDWVLAQPLN